MIGAAKNAHAKIVQALGQACVLCCIVFGAGTWHWRPGSENVISGVFAIFSVEKLIIADFLIFPTIAVTERRVNALI